MVLCFSLRLDVRVRPRKENDENPVFPEQYAPDEGNSGEAGGRAALHLIHRVC